jgi:hypothetical protein
MSLIKELKDQNFDLIDGPSLNYHPLSLWRKRNELEFAGFETTNVSNYFDNIKALPSIANFPAADEFSGINTEKLGLNIGLSLLKTQTGIDPAKFSAYFKMQRTMQFSYSGVTGEMVDKGLLQLWLSKADFNDDLTSVLIQAFNLDQFFVVLAVLKATKISLVISKTTDLGTDAEISAAVSGIPVQGNLQFTRQTESEYHLSYETSDPNKGKVIAAMPGRIKFESKKFKQIVYPQQEIFA